MMTARSLVPGVLIAGTISLAASFLSEHYGAPVMLFALLLGMAFHFLAQEARCRPGLDFASRTILRAGVALLGARITADAVLKLGPTPLLTAVLGVTLTMTLGAILARALGFNRHFGLLTGGSVGICGASAALALSSVLPRGEGGVSERDTIFTVLGVTTLSTVAMVVYPIIMTGLGFTQERAGIFLGSTIHDVAQVVGAGYSLSVEAGDAATVTKLLRVAMLVPVIIVISFVLLRGADRATARQGFPLFLIVFVALVCINSVGLIPPTVVAVMTSVSSWALVAAIAALGIKTSLKDLATVGPRALVLLLAETAWIAILCFSIVVATD